MKTGLVCLAATHQSAALEVRERLAALDTASLATLRARLREAAGAREQVVLSTCNRFEVYAVGADPARLADAVAEAAALPREAFHAASRRLEESDAAAHLFEVAASLDSMIVGETEITGQVKDAYAAAQAAGVTGPVLNRLVQKALQAAKWARSTSAIGEGQVSTATVAVELAGRIFGDLAHARTLVLGAGEIGLKTARALRDRGAGHVAVATRRVDAVAPLAAELGAQAVPFEGVAASLHQMDIVLASTASPEPVLRVRDIDAARQRRAGRPLFLVDLALPRDIEPGADDLADVYVYTLEDLGRIAEANLAARQAEVARLRLDLRARAADQWRECARRSAGG